MMPPLNFRSAQFLRAHIQKTMDFYHPRAIDAKGGFYHYFRDDGVVYDASHRHLVSSTRFIFNYAKAALEFNRNDYRDAARWGLQYLRDVHRNPATGGYAWTIRDGIAEDQTYHAYGVAFVLLAYSTALQAGIEEARPWIAETWDVLEHRYWDQQFNLYRDEASCDWIFSDYRGQNANMHLCEALLATYQATGNKRYLSRASVLAQRMTIEQAALADGLIWEHYDINWNIDWDYNRRNPKHLFRPWGFQPGHQIEWAKLLLTLHQYAPEAWLLPTAQRLFQTSLSRSWDNNAGGIMYGFAPDGGTCDDDKYFWVQAEALATAARLAIATDNADYWDWYDRIWHYVWAHFIDHEHGAWYRLLDRDNRKYSNEKSPAGKTDYHTMGACHDILSILNRSTSPQ